MSQEIAPQGGWYADPYGQPVLRWHDGTAWTAYTVAQPQPQPQATKAPIAVAIAGGGRGGIGGWHLLHLVLTVCTAGLWLPVWIVHAIAGSRRGGNSVNIIGN
jgi:Protein of unknown function (DUF2510)